jgi:hypothetical protein
LKTRHDRAPDIDSIYDITQHPRAEALPQGNGGKPKFVAEKKGRAVSIGAVWKYTDEEDHIYDHELQKKKRKTASSKQRNSALPPSITNPELLVQEEALVATEEETHPNDKNLHLSGSPLTTPPPIEKRTRKKSAKLPPFKKPAITKPFLVSEPKVFLHVNPPFPKPVSNHPGLTTTQDAVKLSQTTLDKLVAFRYTSSSASQPSKVFSENFLGRTDDHQRVHVQQEQYPPVTASHGSTDYGFSNDNSTFSDVSTHRTLPHFDFHDAIHVTEVMQTLQELTSHSKYSTETLTVRLLHNSFYAPVMSHGDSILDATTVGHAERELPENGTHKLEELPVHLPGKISSANCQSSDYDEITSSEAKAVELNLILDHTMHGQSMVGVVQEDNNLVSMADDALCAIQEPRNPDFLQNHGKSHGRLQSPPAQSGALFSEQLPELSAEDCDKYEFAREVEEIAKDASENLEIDEFDQDLNDADFLAIVSDAVAETRVASLKDQITAAHKHSNLLKPNEGTSGRLHNHEASSKVPNNSTTLLVENAPRPNSSDMEDEFPLDEGDEEEMLNLSPVKTSVVENSQLPASLSYGAEEDQGSGEVYNSILHSSPPNLVSSPLLPAKTRDGFRADRLKNAQNDSLDPIPMVEDEDWSFISNDDFRGSQMTVRLPGSQNRISPSTARPQQLTSALSDTSLAKIIQSRASSTSSIAISSAWMSDDSHLYEPLRPFARPDFPALARDRSPIVGVSAQTFLRVCFRVGEMFKEGGRCSAMDQDAVIELFARVTFSSREPGTTKQNFQFADLWHDRPPFPSGLLANYKATGLLETESRAFLGSEEGIMARCFGRLKRDSKSSSGWMLHVISIRVTDWEEIRWTRRIVSAGLVKSEK